MVPGVPEQPSSAGAADTRATPDADLARRIAGPIRDALAEAELCRRFAPRIRLYGLKHLRDEEAARDLAQSVLLAVLEGVRQGRLADPERLDRFVLGTARNLALQARHADGRAAPVETARLDLLAILPEHEQVDLPALHRCLAGLEPRARAVLHLSFAREKSADDIARALGTTPGNVRVVRHRALAQLRRCLDGDAERDGKREGES
jgi:RNA polymerase sigma-70 factor (ECF subfamily)